MRLDAELIFSDDLATRSGIGFISQIQPRGPQPVAGGSADPPAADQINRLAVDRPALDADPSSGWVADIRAFPPAGSGSADGSQVGDVVHAATAAALTPDPLIADTPRSLQSTTARTDVVAAQIVERAMAAAHTDLAATATLPSHGARTPDIGSAPEGATSQFTSGSSTLSIAPGASFAIQGISLSTYGLTNYEGANLPTLLKGAADDGANTVVLSSEAVINLSTGAITDWIVSSGSSSFDQTAKFSDIGPAIAEAEAQGLAVMLKPQIAAYDPSLAAVIGSDYGNLTDPNLVITNPAAFFAGYKAYILQWAELAQEYNVPILSIGNEMLAATKPQYTSYWDDIIDSIRAVYSGKLTYSALLPLNFSAPSGNEVQQIQFWGKLDYAGFDVYPSLTSQLDPSVATLNAAWQQQTIQGNAQSWTQELAQLASSIGKPVLFTETGVASFPGANDRLDYSDAVIGQSGTVSDNAAQANWWQSFFDIWAANKPSWLAGMFIWDNDPGTLTGAYYSEGYNINGKPANTVVAAWYGGDDYLGYSDSYFIGSASNDRICLYGDATLSAALAANGRTLSQSQTFTTTITVVVDGTIINGQTPTLHFYINGIDEGTKVLSNQGAGYVDANGIASSAQTYSFDLPGLVSISQLKVALDSPVTVGGPENSSAFFQAVSINGVALSGGTYTPLPQYGTASSVTLPPEIGGIGTSGLWDGGDLSFDATPWNSAVASRTIGTSANPIDVAGGGGTDTVNVLGLPADYQVTATAAGTVTLTENSGLDQNAVLTGIDYVSFLDGATLNLATMTWRVSNTAANVAADLGDFAPLAASKALSSITLTDGGIPTLSITTDQATADAAVLAAVTGNFSVTETASVDSQTISGVANALGNTVVFSGNANQYTVTPAGDGVRFTVAGTRDIATMTNIQGLQFSDVDEIVAPTPGSNGVVTGGNVTELYGAVFGRIPDVPGLDYYEKELAANPNLSLTTLAEDFLSSPEYTGNPAHAYAQTGPGDAQFITDSYNNLLHRAPESGAIPYYQNLIGLFTQGLTAGTAAYTAAELLAHATVLVDFSASAEFLADVQVTAQNPASAGFTGHWLVLI